MSRHRQITYANVVATLAVLIALAGSLVAAAFSWNGDGARENDENKAEGN